MSFKRSQMIGFRNSLWVHCRAIFFFHFLKHSHGISISRLFSYSLRRLRELPMLIQEAYLITRSVLKQEFEISRKLFNDKVFNYLCTSCERENIDSRMSTSCKPAPCVQPPKQSGDRRIMEELAFPKLLVTSPIRRFWIAKSLFLTIIFIERK